MKTRREEENVVYYDYSPDELETVLDRDAKIVAKAYIYSPNRKYTLSIQVLVSGLDLLTDITPEEAVNHGIRVRDEMVRQHKEEAKYLRENRLMLYNWNGERVVSGFFEKASEVFKQSILYPFTISQIPYMDKK